jgi:hypothetical protein
MQGVVPGKNSRGERRGQLSSHITGKICVSELDGELWYRWACLGQQATTYEAGGAQPRQIQKPQTRNEPVIDLGDRTALAIDGP